MNIIKPSELYYINNISEACQTSDFTQEEIDLLNNARSLKEQRKLQAVFM